MPRFTPVDICVLTRFWHRQRSHRTLHERARHTIMLLIAGQLAIALVIVAGVTAAMGLDKGYAALVGGLIGVLPNYYFAGRLMRRRTNAAPEQSLREIYVGEFVKIAFTAALFVIAIKLLSVDFLVVVLTYLAVVMANWLALLVINLGEVRQSVGSEIPVADEKYEV